MSEPYYKDEYVTLYHGNALENSEWLTADYLVTDPPYGIALKARKGRNDMNHKSTMMNNVIANDETTDARDKVLALWGDKPALVFGSWKIPRPIDTRQLLIWHKKGQAPGPLNAPFMTQHEEIYVLGKGFKSSSPPLMSVIQTTEHRSTQVRMIGHPTPKPIDLMEVLLERCDNGVIADPFAGSGATLIAARNLKKHSIGIELEEKYCEIIAKRLSQASLI